MSPTAKLLLSSTIATRVAEGHVGAKHQMGAKYLERIEALAIELAKKLYKAEYAELRVLSGSMANAMSFSALTTLGDTIMSLNVPNGGHISYREFGVAGYLKLRIRDIPFDEKDMNVDTTGLARMLEEIRPKLVVLGGSLILFPYPLEDIRKIVEDTDCIIHYDGAHVAGLVAGGEFQDPLHEGADVFTTSTYKTLGGPSGGLVLCNDDKIAKKIDKAAFPGMTANIHYNRVAAMAVVLAEFLEFGSEYARQTVRNAKKLARALDREGFDVLCKRKGFTRSHQVAVDVSTFGGGKESSVRLEKANIICNDNLLPGDSLKMIRNPSGLRLGVQELTRLGMKEKEMRQVAELMSRVLIDKENPMRIAAEVKEFRKNYTKVHYCFNRHVMESLNKKLN
jgi:glycine hydroxymethyltransferase